MMGADAPIPPCMIPAAEVEERFALFSRLIPAEFNAPKGVGRLIIFQKSFDIREFVIIKIHSRYFPCSSTASISTSASIASATGMIRGTIQGS